MGPEQVSIGVLIDAVPRDAVDEAVAVCGVRERGSDGKLPAHVTAYLTFALSLFADDDYEEVATKVTGSLDRFGSWNAAWTVPTASAITQARKRLGREVFSEIFERTCGPVAGDTGPTAGLLALGTARGSFLRGWRLLAIDGFEPDVPDTPANAAEFGYPGPGTTGRRSARRGWWRCRSAAPTPSSRPRSTATRSGRKPLPSGCISGFAPMSC
ncbi:MAG: transposase domain-containing protein [Actinomycetes bacterium]